MASTFSIDQTYSDSLSLSNDDFILINFHHQVSNKPAISSATIFLLMNTREKIPRSASQFSVFSFPQEAPDHDLLQLISMPLKTGISSSQFGISARTPT